MTLDWIAIGEDRYAAELESYCCEVLNGKKGSWHYTVVHEDVLVEENRLKCPDEQCAKSQALKVIVAHKKKREAEISEANLLHMVNEDELSLSSKSIQLLPSRLLLHVQAALFYMAHPESRRILIECLDEVQTTSSLEAKLPQSKAMIYKSLGKMVFCGLLIEVNSDESRKVGISKNYVANKKAIALATVFAQKYCDEVAIEDMLALQTARLAYKRSGNIS